MKTARITIDRSSHDCECCGYYESSSFMITVDGGAELYGERDGHFGGGAWHGDHWSVLMWALRTLGYALSVNGQPIACPPFHEVVDDQWHERTIFDGEPTVIELSAKLAFEEDEEQELAHAALLSVTLPPLPGIDAFQFAYTPASESDGGWEGGWVPVLLKLLHQRVALQFEAT